MDKMIRLKEPTVGKLKELKKDMGFTSYEQVIAKLVDTHLEFKEIANDFGKPVGHICHE